MATQAIVQQDWKQLEARAFDLFVEYPALNIDDALLAALVEGRDYALAHRALALLDMNQAFTFAHAFRIVRETDRQFADDDMVLPFEERRAA